MPRSLALLIIIGILSGTWSTFGPRFGHPSEIKGTTTNRIKVQKLPELAPLPARREKYVEPNISARNIAVIDVDTGYFLYEKESDKSIPVASLTKVMTAMIVLENLQLNKVVEIPNEANQTIGSLILFKKGEKMTIENLLYALLISSGNDAALALAMQFGTVDNFVKIMNEKAKKLGMKNTSFKDPAGLNDEGVSSTRDMATLMAYALRNQTFKKIINTSQLDITSSDGTIVHKLENSNRLVKEEMYYPGIIGGKTGFTPIAGHNLVAAASRDNHTIVTVIINTYSQTNDASAIETNKALDWAFSNHVW